MAFQKVGDKVVRPEDVCFTQESICVTFKRPREHERIDDAVDQIIQGRLSPKAFPRMNVVQFQDRLWSLDNRRLWVFKKAEVRFITVTIVACDYGLHSLMSTSPYLYCTLSKRDFFPRIRGLCKEIFADEDQDEPSLPTTSGERVPKVYSKSKHFDYEEQQHRRPHHRSNFNVQNWDEQSVPRLRGPVVSPPPQSKKRPLQTERHHSRTSPELRSQPPAKKSRASNSPAPARTPYGDRSSPTPAQHLRGHASHHMREFRAPSAMQKAPIPMTPEQRPKAPRPQAEEIRAPSSTKKANPPSSSMKPGTVTRSSERVADRSGNLPSCRTTELNVQRSREKRPAMQPSQPSREKHAEKGLAVPPVSKEKRAERDREATSAPRAVEDPKRTPAPKRSKTPKPMSSPPNFSYDFHSSGKKCRASKGSKRTTGSGPSTKSSSTRLDDAPFPTPAPPKTRHAKSKMPTAPLPSLSTTASPSSTTTKRKERDDGSTADLPIPAVPAPKSPPATSKKPDQELNSGSSPTTKETQESPALVDGQTMTQTESNLFKLDKQAPEVDPELHPRLTPCKELTSQEKQTLNAIIELFLRDARSPLQSAAQAKPTVEAQTEQTEAVIPTDEVCVKPQQEEPQDVSVRVVVPPSVVECPVKYDSQGQLFESTLKVLWPLSNPSTTYCGDGDRLRPTGNVGVTLTADLEPPVVRVQSIPVSGRQVEETQPETKGNVTDQHQLAPAQGTKGLSRCCGFRDMFWIEKDEFTATITKPIQEVLPKPGNEKVSQRITRGQIKTRKEMERRKGRQKRKGKEKEAKTKTKKKESETTSLLENEREEKTKKEQENKVKSLQKEERESKPKVESKEKSLKKKKSKKKVSTEIVPYDPERRKEASSGRAFGVGTVQNGDMLYVKVDAEFTGCGTEGLKTSPRCKARLHPYLRIIGPFAVQRRYNAFSVRLELPDDCNLRPVFCLKDLLKSRSPLDNYLPEQRISVKLEPETVLKKRMARRLKKRKVLHYLVKWKTLPATEATWESETIFDEYPHLLDQIHDCPCFPNPFLQRNWRA